MLEAVKRAFLPEFINRIDEIVTFHPLTGEQIERITRLIVDRVGHGFEEERGIALEVSEGLVARLVREGSMRSTAPGR
jgi:ATP-dependent Clp protease ATP-binding subunit ClpC